MILKEVLKNIKSLTLENKKSILIGVSGGVDSIFLVDVISKLNKQYNLFNEVILVYINYVSNPNSYDRLNLCEKISKKYEFPLIVRKSNLNKKILNLMLENKGIKCLLIY